ncbi:hypothetical protein EVG20_g1228 [Dentipellis fragilis]|uniref:Xylanolytic transcriptional activator regulatory domain-containing protein n=1 Tax=Dentipellis fragilis TaxID=205917 RepID=A0A4Y9ZA97_9AGAM|nr:hypothetical protein EVG20_g1228 [Dentipellis fragilis]
MLAACTPPSHGPQHPDHAPHTVDGSQAECSTASTSPREKGRELERDCAVPLGIADAGSAGPLETPKRSDCPTARPPPLRLPGLSHRFPYQITSQFTYARLGQLPHRRIISSFFCRTSFLPHTPTPLISFLLLFHLPMSHPYNDPSSSYPRSPPIPDRHVDNPHQRAHTPPAQYRRMYHSSSTDYPVVKVESPSSDADHLPYAQHHSQQHPQQYHLPSAPPHSATPPFRFGSGNNSPHPPLPSFSFMSQPGWNNTSSSPSYPSSSHHPHFTLPPLQHVNDQNLNMLSMNDEYDDGDELADLPPGSAMGSSVSFDVIPGGSGKADKVVRRRSSKACDQCRKSKCKCERSSEHEPCKSCVMLGTGGGITPPRSLLPRIFSFCFPIRDLASFQSGIGRPLEPRPIPRMGPVFVDVSVPTPMLSSMSRPAATMTRSCTFLGPSRKRGPPKGYIDAIEARLHQTEALIGILLAANDVRAKGILEDLSQDKLARDIIARVDNSPYGIKGRSRGAEAPGSGKDIGKTKAQMQASVTDGKEDDSPPLQSTHPSNEWQDRVIAEVNSLALSRNENAWAPGDSPASHTAPQPTDSEAEGTRRAARPTLSIVPPNGNGASRSLSPTRRQRRRVGEAGSMSAHPSLGGRRAAARRIPVPLPLAANGDRDRGTPDALDDNSEEDELAGEVGQLSLNEEREVRYHGKASGLHLLGVKDRVDGRNEGGIWRFPKARVWPPLPSNQYQRNEAREEEELAVTLPPLQTQERLLDLYFTFVHPALPIVHKKTFMEDFRSGHIASGASPNSNASEGTSPSSSSPVGRRRPYIPPLLLLVMFSIAARYTTRSDTEVPPPPEGEMWPAGDSYLDKAKILLNRTYASSRSSTCQALLLMGYREIGIGAMAQAWLYIGMAVRMAQDLGIHKSADRWQHVGASLFNPVELQERRRIWYACVIMDKYVSSYIGRPIAIYERDFDVDLPSVDEPEEREDWHSRPSTDAIGHDPDHGDEKLPLVKPVVLPGHVISCFNASATLSIILSKIVQAIYAVRFGPGRHAESLRLEELLDKWYIDLPGHLRYDPAAAKKGATPPPPHVLTLHMQYWCVVLLLHRPFMRYVLEMKTKGPPAHEDPEVRAISQKNYDLCVQAANSITSIVATYREHYCIKRASVFLSFYIFTAGIMHVNTLNVFPTDPQARLGLTTCMEILRNMSIVWPSAGRAWELLNGSNVNIAGAKMEMANLVTGPAPRKRNAEHFLEDSHFFAGAPPPNHRTSVPSHGFPVANVPPPSAVSPTTHGVSGNGIPYYTSYDRWPGDGLGTYNGSLSTSVLPQQYSTGFVVERVRPAPADASSPHAQRYPQYWSDYSTLNQLSTPYGVPLLQEMGNAPEHQHAHSQHQHHPPQQMYLPDQYQMYGNIPPSHS